MCVVVVFPNVLSILLNMFSRVLSMQGINRKGQWAESYECAAKKYNRKFEFAN